MARRFLRAAFLQFYHTVGSLWHIFWIMLSENYFLMCVIQHWYFLPFESIKYLNHIEERKQHTSHVTRAINVTNRHGGCRSAQYALPFPSLSRVNTALKLVCGHLVHVIASLLHNFISIKVEISAYGASIYCKCLFHPIVCYWDSTSLCTQL